MWGKGIVFILIAAARFYSGVATVSAAGTDVGRAGEVREASATTDIVIFAEQDPGKLFIENALARIEREIHALWRMEQVPEKQKMLILNFERLSRLSPEILYAPGTDSRFRIPGVTEPRSAVTNTFEHSPILFNLDVINDFPHFNYEEAVRLLGHELGHKVHEDLKRTFPDYQTAVDEFANHMATAATMNDIRRTFRFDDYKISLSAHLSFSEGHSLWERERDVHWPLITIESGSKLFNLSTLLFDLYRKFNEADGLDYYVSDPIVHDIELTKQLNADTFEFKFLVSFAPVEHKHLGSTGNRYLDEFYIRVALAKNDQTLRVDKVFSRYVTERAPVLPITVAVTLFAKEENQSLRLFFDEHLRFATRMDWSLQAGALFRVGDTFVELPIRMGNWQWWDTTPNEERFYYVDLPASSETSEPYEFLGVNAVFFIPSGSPFYEQTTFFPFNNYFLPVSEIE